MPHKVLGVVMDPIDQINPANDTTLGLLLAAQTAGWQLQYMTPSDVFWRQDQLFAHTDSLALLITHNNGSAGSQNKRAR